MLPTEIENDAAEKQGVDRDQCGKGVVPEYHSQNGKRRTYDEHHSEQRPRQSQDFTEEFRFLVGHNDSVPQM